ncbi:MAG: hypothetical protein C5B48_05135 [Candidatus Rokuibacteriota bacterium]|nr:MAG: hypothetical protein C5B48_05135 [Candidatus Rokubacteria bacterium]
MVEWCAANLTFAEFRQNELAPPLPYAAESFELLYAFSVFTHLPRELQQAWTEECYRVLAPGGYLIFSTLGEHYLTLDRLTESEQQTFAEDELVVLYEGSPGTSLCSAYHPVEYVRRRMAGDFEVLEQRPAADDASHDLHLFRKPLATSDGPAASAR